MSGIVINIKAGATFEKSSVTATGQLVAIIADSERASFGIGSDADLKRAIGNHFGKQPTDAFLHSPTPWNDLYKTYGWSQVQRVLEPKKAVILSVTAKPTIVATKTLKNKGKVPATFSTKISEQVSNSSSSQWSRSSTFNIGQSFNYKLDCIVAGSGGQSSFGFTHNWGNNETVTKQTTLGSETGVSVLLQPGESEIVELNASMGTMRVRITYEAYLRGQTAVNYYPKYKDHHFYGLQIGDVLGGSNKVEITEDIEISLYSNATAEMKNAR